MYLCIKVVIRINLLQARRQQQIRNLERKLEKARSSLQEEDEVNVSDQDLQHSLMQHGIDNDKHHR